MKRPAKTIGKGRVVALALTWDGARWPVRTLPPKARAFLAGKSRNLGVPASRVLAKAFVDDQVREIRVCWVPRLKGGDSVLSEPFPVPTGKRIPFRCARTIRFGDVLGVIYQRR